jgi:hypothetical protein
MSQVFKLFRLQQLDSQLDLSHTRLDQIQRKIDDNSVLQKAQAQVEAAEEEWRDSKKSLRRAEEEVQSHRLKIEETEAALYGGKVRNPKELQDLQKEAAALKRYLAVLEDRLLECMLVDEEKETEYKKKLNELQVIQSETESLHKNLISEKDVLSKEIDTLDNERILTVNAIGPDDLQLYTQLRQQRRGVAVAKVADSACAACGSMLTPALVQAAHSPSQIVRCTFCGRILYAV